MRILLTLLFVFIGVTFLTAQDRKNFSPEAKQEIERLEKSLVQAILVRDDLKKDLDIFRKETSTLKGRYNQIAKKEDELMRTIVNNRILLEKIRYDAQRDANELANLEQKVKQLDSELVFTKRTAEVLQDENDDYVQKMRDYKTLRKRAYELEVAQKTLSYSERKLEKLTANLNEANSKIVDLQLEVDAKTRIGKQEIEPSNTRCTKLLEYFNVTLSKFIDGVDLATKANEMEGVSNTLRQLSGTAELLQIGIEDKDRSKYQEALSKYKRLTSFTKTAEQGREVLRKAYNEKSVQEALRLIQQTDITGLGEVMLNEQQTLLTLLSNFCQESARLHNDLQQLISINKPEFTRNELKILLIGGKNVEKISDGFVYLRREIQKNIYADVHRQPFDNSNCQ